MRTASQCMAMAVRMDGLAAGDTAPAIRDAWTRMALYWRDLARQADWQDRYTAPTPESAEQPNFPPQRFFA